MHQTISCRRSTRKNVFDPSQCCVCQLGLDYKLKIADSGIFAMPYRTIDDLPLAVRRHLPHHAQDIYRAAFNHAFAAHAGDPRQEEIAHRTAWSAVKRCYVKIGDSWVANSSHMQS